MRGILNKKGMTQCYNFTEGKVYEFTVDGAGYEFRNDRNHPQGVTTDGVFRVPDDYFVVKVTEKLNCYPWEVGDYLVAKKDVDADFYNILHYDTFNVCRRCHAQMLAPQAVTERKVKIPKYIVIEQEVHGLTVGMHYEVNSINISGSYMVACTNGMGTAIVAPSKCHPWVNGEYKTVPCRDVSFSSPATSVAPAVPPLFPPVAPAVPPMAPKRAAPPKLVPDELTPKNKKIIKKQKALAAELLERFGFYGNAIIAGGAPRNWWFNRPANDLDIFIPAPTDFTGNNLRAIMEREGITDVYNMATHNPDGTLKAKRPKGKSSYDDRMSDIHSVFEGKYCGQTVQVIWTTVSTYGYIESHFDTSINMIFSTLSHGELTVQPCYEFMQGVKAGAIFVHDNQCAYSNAHLEKVANYFPEVPLVWYEEISECEKDPSYVWEVAKTWEDHLQDQLDAEKEFDCW